MSPTNEQYKIDVRAIITLLHIIASESLTPEKFK